MREIKKKNRLNKNFEEVGQDIREITYLETLCPCFQLFDGIYKHKKT